MSDRYQEVFRMPSRLHLYGSPVLIETGVLQKDNQQNRILAQIKFRNITDRYIIACKVSIKAYEINGTELEGIDSFSYLDINVNPGNVFGAKTPSKQSQWT